MSEFEQIFKAAFHYPTGPSYPSYAKHFEHLTTLPLPNLKETFLLQRGGGFCNAVIAYRERTGVGLKDAYDMITVARRILAWDKEEVSQ